MRPLILIVALALHALQFGQFGVQMGTLSGRVVTFDGQPAAGVRVAAMEAPEDGGLGEASVLASLTRTDENGRYTLEDIPPGRYYVVAGPIEEPAYHAEPVTVAAGASIDGLDIDLTILYRGVIEVKVHLAGSERPIAGAPVTAVANIMAYSAAGLPVMSGVTYEAVTNATGVALFSGLRGGSYTVSTPAGGYAVRPPGVPAGRDVSVSITIGPGQETWDVSIGVLRPNTVTGVVRSGDGSPAPGALVSALAVEYRFGRRTLIPVISVRADDSGAYSLILTRGEYYIRAGIPLLGAAITDIPAAPATYHPASSHPGNAIPLALRGMEEVDNVDVTMGRRYRVAGRIVLGSDPEASLDSATASFYYSARNILELDSPRLANRAAVTAAGEFAVDLPEGAWDLFSVATLPGAEGPVRVLGRIPVEVAGADTEGLSLVVDSHRLAGQVNGAGLATASIRLNLVPKDNTPQGLLLDLASASASFRFFGVDENGAFLLPSVPPGRYSIEAMSLPVGYYIADVRLGAESVLENGIFAIGDSPSLPLEIVLDAGAGAVRGRAVLPSGGVPSNARVVLVPDGSRRSSAFLYRTVAVSLEGAFVFPSNLTPGNYKLFAFQRPPSNGAEHNPEFLAAYDDRAVPITVTANETANVTLGFVD